MSQPMGMQPTGFTPQPTGFVPQQTGFASQATGFASQQTGFGMQTGGFGNGGMQMQPTGFGGMQHQQQSGFMQPQATGFGGSSMYNQAQQQQQPQQQPHAPIEFNPMPPSSTGAHTVASSGASHNAPSNVFAAMKDGTFAAGSTHLPPQDSSRYDALRAQPTGFAGNGMMPQMTGFMPQQQNYGYSQVCFGPCWLPLTAERAADHYLFRSAVLRTTTMLSSVSVPLLGSRILCSIPFDVKDSFS